jgi:DNA repair exonuclease SbcCD ATPase subunit
LIRFKKIQVQNYKAIEYAELDFLSGVYKVIGVNNDSTYTSNGAGKSTILQALVLGLYNKDFTGAPLDTLSNRFTGKPYSILITMDAFLDGKFREVTVLNPAGAARMTLRIDGVLEAQGAVVVLPKIESMLGMGYATFKLTHYITSSTITNLTQNLSQPTIFNDILHIVELQELDKRLLSISKTVNESLDNANDMLKTFTQHSKVTDLQAKYNLPEITKDLESAINTLELVQAKYAEKTSPLKATISTLKNEILKLDDTISQTKTSLRHGVCSLCKSILVSNDALNDLNTALQDAESMKSVKEQELHEANSQLLSIDRKFESANMDALNSVALLKQDLKTAEELLNIDIDIVEDPSGLIQELNKQVSFISTARKEIKSGKVIKNILEQFFNIVSIKLHDYSELIQLNHFDISLSSDKLGMSIDIQQNGISVPIELLSNGEKTRLSLLILVSMLDAMKVVSESETNVVVFDESSSSLDASGADEMMRLFSYLKHMGQSVFLVTHGSELDMIPYDYQLTVTKDNGKSYITVQEL